MVDDYSFKKVSIFVVLGILAVLAITLLWPISTSILTGLILAYVFYPVFRKILGLVREKNVSALIVIFLVLLLIFIPLWLLLPVMVKQIFEAYLFLQNLNISNVMQTLFPSLMGSSQHVINSVNTFISGFAMNVFSYFSGLVGDLPNLALKIVIILFVFFFGMRDGEALIEYVKSLSPFKKSVEAELAKKFKEITNSVIYGHIVVGIIQGLATGVGLLVFGVKNALFLTIVSILAAIIPVLGAWLIWIPASVYLMALGSSGRGIGLFLYGAIVISWIDNVLRAYIVSRKSKVSSAIVVVGMMGGLLVFGILGLIIGPLILAYLLLILDAYRNRKFSKLFN